MRRLILLLALAAACAWSIDIPRVGFARDPQGRVRAIDGVAGNFILGDAITGGLATAFAWNGTYGIRKTESSIECWDAAATRIASIDAPPGDAVIGFDRDTAWIYAKSNQSLFELRLNQWRMITVPAGTGEEVLGLGGLQDSIDLAVRRPEGLFVVTIDRITGDRVGERAVSRPASRVVFLQNDAMAGIDGSTIWLRRSDGSEWSVETGVPLSDVSRMGAEWLQVIATDRQFALRISGPEPSLYQLPEAGQ